MAVLIVGCPRGWQALTATLLNALQYVLQLLIAILLQFADHEVGNQRDQALPMAFQQPDRLWGQKHFGGHSAVIQPWAGLHAAGLGPGNWLI